MSRRHLTEKQLAFLDFLRQHVHSHRVWPTYREVVDHFEFRSPNSVTQNLRALTRKGYLERDHNGYRLADGSGDGRVAVRSALRPSGRERLDAPVFLTLAAFFGNVDGLHAVRLAPDTPRSERLAEADYAVVGALTREGMVLARTDEQVGVWEWIGGTVYADGVPVEDAEVVGAYVGHIGPAGIVRYRPAVEA